MPTRSRVELTYADLILAVTDGASLVCGVILAAVVLWALTPEGSQFIRAMFAQ